MNTLHIIDHMGFGGAQNIVKDIFENSVKENIFCFVLRKKEKDIKLENSNAFYSKSKNKYGFSFLFELRKIIEENNINLMHCHLIKSLFAGYVLKKIWFKNIKLIFHEHGCDFKNLWWYRAFLKISESKVDLFIAVSNNEKIKLIKNAKIKESKIKVLYNFVDLKKFNPSKYYKNQERKKLGLSEGDFIVGFVGRLTENKQCELLIKTMPEIIRCVPCAKLLIVGDGEERIKLKKLSERLEINTKVYFIGRVNNVAPLISAFDLGVVPSKSEGFPLVLIEIQAMGIPVIATNIAELIEVIKDNENGLLFENGNEKDLVGKIQLLFKNKKLKNKLIKKATVSVRNLSLKKYMENLKNIYKTL